MSAKRVGRSAKRVGRMLYTHGTLVRLVIDLVFVQKDAGTRSSFKASGARASFFDSVHSGRNRDAILGCSSGREI